jgi:hypothetical protein
VTVSKVGPLSAASPDDLPAIVGLFERVYPQSGFLTERLTAHLRRILTEHPWQTERIPSLTYRDRSGRVVGFIGVLPRPMLAGGRPIVMAVGHHFMVDPEHRTTLAGVQLLKAFVSGEQDLSICESAADVRRLWHAVGGTTSLLYSPIWTRPLQPSTYFASLLEQRGRMRTLATGLLPACRLIDWAATTARPSPYFLDRPAAGDESLDAVPPDALLAYIERFSERCYLRPHYDVASLTWLLEVLAAKRAMGRLEIRVVRKAQAVQKGQDGLLGYFVYFAKPGGVGQVLQVGGRSEAFGEVLRALAAHAKQQGAIALSGRLDPRYLTEISGPSSFKHTGNWLLVHSRDATIERAIHLGDAFLTRLESEWWLPFHE